MKSLLSGLIENEINEVAEVEQKENKQKLKQKFKKYYVAAPSS
jgi:hypothetical protein